MMSEEAAKEWDRRYDSMPAWIREAYKDSPIVYFAMQQYCGGWILTKEEFLSVLAQHLYASHKELINSYTSHIRVCTPPIVIHKDVLTSPSPAVPSVPHVQH